jgi:cell division septation protein DedD
MAGRKGGDSDMVLGGRHLVGIFALLVVVMGVVFTLGYLLGRGQYDAQLNPSVEAAIRKVDKFAGKPEKPERLEKSEKPGKALPASHPSAADGGPADGVGNPSADFDFYHAGEGEKAPDRLEAPPKPVASKPKSVAAPAELKPVTPKASAAPAPAKGATATIPDKAAATPAKAAAPVDSTPAVPAAKSGALVHSTAPLNTPQIPAGATVLQVAALVREADALALAQALQQKKFPAFVLTPGEDHFYRVQVGPYGNAQSAAAARHALESQGFKSIIKR